MKSLEGKKLLIISSDGCDIEFVNAAREMGLYVVCCDRYSDYKISPAKQLADEAWDIDYTDTEKVAAKCREAGINGVIAGYGEDRVTAACRISKAIGTHFYATEEQINFTRNKRLFKEACRKCGLNVPREFCNSLPMTEQDLKQIEYPVIVKPADNGGRKGISVCYNEQELMKAIPLAEENSKNGEIVVEEYFIGDELSAVYTVVDGEMSLSCLNDKYLSCSDEGISTLCDFVVTPSKYYKQFKDEVDEKAKKFIKEMNIKNGSMNFQLIASKNKIIAFEIGYRVNGNNDFKVIRRFNDIDFMKMLIHYSITGEMGDSIEKDNPEFSEFFCTYVVHLNAGTVKKIDYQKLYDYDNIEDIEIWRQLGDVVRTTGTNAHKSGMIKFTAKTKEDIVETIGIIRKNLIIEDETGKNMCRENFDTKRLSLCEC